MRSYLPLIVGAVLAASVQGSPDHESIHARVARGVVNCKPTAGSCSSCGPTWVACGTDACYNPVAGDACCSNRYACPSTFDCVSTGIGCIPRSGKPRECPEEFSHLISSSTSTSSASSSSSATMPSTSVSTTGSTSGSSSSSSTIPNTSASSTDSIPSSSSSITTGSTTSTLSSSFSTTTGVNTGTLSSSSSSTDSSTTNVTITLTSTMTSTITITGTNQATGACSATNPLTTPAPYGNFSSTSMVALNTTTSTLSITNLSSTPPVTISPISINATKPTGTIVPSISGFQGAAGRSEASLFALGSLVFMATLLI